MSNGIRYINPEGTCPAQGLYSHATYTPGGPLYFIAGQLSVGLDGGVVGTGDFAAQFKQVFDNLGDVLSGLGAGFEDVVKFTTYLVDSQNIAAFMDLRAALFPEIFKGPLFPPNTLLIVDRLVKQEFLLEVEAVVQAKQVAS
ncbi:RidA family protein [Zavarzinia compransoris]|uniref:RidA family protein n=1 Tax=Zavarzinia marina TaxID=2911065 RepID=UPI001F2E3216|nr:RidA family protein [Zavarzinia marina]MCF4167355.1 RidA family protein [Zavarzinia marina]